MKNIPKGYRIVRVGEYFPNEYLWKFKDSLDKNFNNQINPRPNIDRINISTKNMYLIIAKKINL